MKYYARGPSLTHYIATETRMHPVWIDVGCMFLTKQRFTGSPSIRGAESTRVPVAISYTSNEPSLPGTSTLSPPGKRVTSKQLDKGMDSRTLTFGADHWGNCNNCAEAICARGEGPATRAKMAEFNYLYSIQSSVFQSTR